MKAVAESGEVLIRRRWRYLTDGLAIPMQLQVLESDFLDAYKTIALPNGGKIVQGVEFDAIGNRVAYWLFPNHPGAVFQQIQGQMFPASRRTPASEIIHVFKQNRPGQVRAVSWFAPVIVRMKEFDEYEDATLMKQKIAACLAIVTTDVDGAAPSLGTADDTQTPAIDELSPGGIINAAPGRSIEVVQPPSVTDHATYCNVTLRAIASGLGLTYEDLTGDYTNMPFSAARMSRLRHWARVDDWRWQLLIPQFCEPVWDWAMEAAVIMGMTSDPAPAATWTPPPMPMVDPDKEGIAIMRNLRTGTQTLFEAIRERGWDPDEFLAEVQAGNTKLDALGIKLDSDPRYMTQAGQLQGAAAPKKVPAPGAAA
jgi:lambda family phage portal protein